MPARKPATSPAAPTLSPCPACAWFSRWLVERLGFRAGERLRVVESHRLVVILPGSADDEGAAATSATSAAQLWPAVVAAAAAQNPTHSERR